MQAVSLHYLKSAKRGITMKLRKIANNQTVIETKRFDILISYETPVASYDKQTFTYYRTEKKWSATTTRHINQWLNGVEAKTGTQEYFDNLLNSEN